MKILFLGSGTSTGVPQIGCKCAACNSKDSKDKRLRASVLIENNDLELLIDCGPDFRQQFLAYNLSNVSGVLLTHEHYDHVGGLDDVRPLGNVQVYAEERVLKTIQRNMPYCFGDNKYPGVPKLHLNSITEEAFQIGTQTIQPIRVMHAKLPILGYRIGNVAYLTDVKSIEEQAYNQLQELDILIINALRHDTHISHLTLNEALEIANKVDAKMTYFTHMSHDMGLHEEVNRKLPKNIQLAYDGLCIELTK